MLILREAICTTSLERWGTVPGFSLAVSDTYGDIAKQVLSSAAFGGARGRRELSRTVSGGAADSGRKHEWSMADLDVGVSPLTELAPTIVVAGDPITATTNQRL